MEKKVCCKVWLRVFLFTALLLFGLPVGRTGKLQVVRAEDYKNLTPVASGNAGATKEDSVKWAVYDTDGDDVVDTLVFSGQGAMGSGSGKWENYEEDLKLVIEDGVTTISDSAFWLMNLVGDLTLPASVTNIGSFAFQGCKKLDGTLTIEGELQKLGAYAFADCSNLKGSVVLPKNAEVIRDGVYDKCANLTGTLEIPDSVTEIGAFSFADCTGLEGELTFPSNLVTIEMYAFRNCSGLTGDLVLPDGVVTLKKSAFSGCSNLDGILSLPSSLTKIEENVFDECEKLTGNLDLPESLTSIGSGAFYGCSNLTGKVTIPDNIKEISRNAFRGCSKLESIDLGSVESIGSAAFQDCTGLSGQLYLPDTLTSMDTYVFYNCSNLTGILTIPDGIKEIKAFTFQNTGFTSIAFPKNLEVIEKYAFSGSAIQSDVVIPEGTKEIGAYAFSNSKGMKEKVVIIPYSVTSVADSAFNSTNAVVYNLSEVNVGSSKTYTLGSVNTLTKVCGTQISTRKVLPENVCEDLTRYHYFPIADYDDTENFIWYRDAACTNRIAGSMKLTADTTVYGADKKEQEGFAIKEVSGLVYGEAFTLETTGGNGEGAVTFSVPENNGVLDLDGAAATIVGVGTVTVTATKGGNDEYKPATATLDITVSPKEITEDMVGEIEEQRYTGTDIVPEVEVKDGDTQLKRSRDYKIDYKNNINICDKTAPEAPTAVIQGIGNYTGEVTRTFTIMRPRAEVTIEEGKEELTKTYGDSPFLLTGITKTGDGVLIYDVKEGEDVISVSGDGLVTILKAGGAVIGITTEETIAYSPAEEKTISITVSKAPYAPLIPMSRMYVESTCETIGDVNLPGEWKWSDEDKDIPLITDEAVSATAFYEGADKGNYEVEEITVSVTRVECDHVLGNVVIDEESCERDRKPTCTQIGYGHRECTKCGHIIEIYIRVDALGHTGGVADCIHKAVCERCKEEYAELDSTRHNRASERKNAKEATCTKDGNSGDLYCKDCGEKVENGTVIKALGHKWDAGRVTKAATAAENGVMTYTCSVCKETKTEVIPKSGTLPKVGDTLTDPATKAKYKITGISADGKTGTVQYVKPTTKSIKTVKMAASITSGGITFKVTSIKANAFSGCKKLKTVKIGSNVTTIGNKAFYKCMKLTKITIPAKVTKIGKQAFGGCKALKSITIKTKKLTTKKVGKNAFKGISAKAKIKVPKNKKKAYQKLLKSRGVGSKAKII